MKRKYLLCITACVILLSSCEKYLDVKKNNFQSLIETANDCQLLLDNYDAVNGGYPYMGTLSADEYYIRTQDYQLDDVGQEERRAYIWDPTVLPSTDQWRLPYNRIYNANLVLEAVEKIRDEGSSDEATLNGLQGAALFIRGYNHWQLAQLFAKPYTAESAGQDPGIPLRLNSDINETSSRGTVGQTYSGILDDLRQAASLLQPNSIQANRPDKAAAYALLARVYQSMEDYPLALENASAALQLQNGLVDYNALDTLSDTPFATRYNQEVLFQSVSAESVLLYPIYNSAMARIDSNLASSYSENDLRRYVFFSPSKETRIDPATGENYRDADGNDILFADGSFYFTGNYEPRFSSLLYSGLTVDELYLVRAESYARAGNATAAMADLNTLLVTRWKAGTYVNRTASSAEEALSIILEERKKELLMRGMRWTDLRRLNRDSRFAKTLTRQIDGVAYSLPPNDPRYVLLIPNDVIQFTNMQQNPR